MDLTKQLLLLVATLTYMQFDKLRTMTTDTDKCLCRASEQLINQIDIL